MDGNKPASWSRRAVLTTTGTVGALVVAGCVSEDDPGESEDGENPENTENDDSGENDGETPQQDDQIDPPDAVVEAFFGAYERTDVEEMNALIHGESPIDQFDKKEMEESDSLSFAGLDAKTVEKTDGEAIVELLVTIDPPEREAMTRPVFVEVRKADGEWRIWTLDAEYDGENARVPRARFDFDGPGEKTEISHREGTPVRADRLYVRGEGLAATGSWASLGGEATGEIDGHPAVQEGDVLAIGTEDSYEARLVWEKGDLTVLMTSVAASTESDGAGAEQPPTDQGVEAYLAHTENFDGEIADRTGADEVTVTAGEPDGPAPLGFSPPAIRVDPGTTVTWEAEVTAHTVTSADGEFGSGILEEGDTWEYAFEEPGEYLYLCEPHAGMGMRGAVVVEERE